MKNKKSILLGVLVLVLTVGLNVRHILDNYGVKGNKLHVAVLAQSNGSGDDSSGGGSSGSGGSSSGGDNCPNCPDVHYTSKSKITASVSSYNVTSNTKGEVSFTYGDVVSVKGDFQKNKVVAILVEIKNCESTSSCSCCDQRTVGAKIM